MSNIASRLKSQSSLVAVLVLALVAQMPHAQHVFYANSHDHSWFGWLQSWGGAIALEVAVLVFVIRGNVRVSWSFAAFSVAINLMYYYDLSIAPYVSPMLLSIGLPLAIALYSHEVAEDHAQSDTGEAQPVSEGIKVVANTPAQPLAQLADATIESAELTELQPVASGSQSDTQLDDIDEQIVDAVRNGNYTPYAISKVVSCSLTTLKRRKSPGSEEYIGRIPNLVAAGVLHNSSGSDGNEYRLA